MVQSVLFLNGPVQSVLCLTHQIQTADSERPAQAAPAKRLRLTAEQQRLVEDNMRLATWLVHRATRNVRPDHIPDLIQTAFLAMCRAARRFDPALGIPFASYAAPACKRAVRDEMNERLGVIALPRWLFRQAGVGHAWQSQVAVARTVAFLDETNEPEAARGIVDDHLDAEAMLTWLSPADQGIITAWLGGETIRHIAARLGRRQWKVGEVIRHILGELRRRASR